MEIDCSSYSPVLSRVVGAMKEMALSVQATGSIVVAIKPQGMSSWLSMTSYVDHTNQNYDQPTIFAAASLKMARVMETGKTKASDIYCLTNDYGRFVIVFQSAKRNEKDREVLISGMEVLTQIFEEFDRLCGVFIDAIQVKKMPQLLELFCQHMI